MKYKINIVFFLILTTLYIHSENIKDTFSIVFIKDADYLLMYESANLSSEVIAKIPSGTVGLKTTWKTANNENTSWIEIIYNDKKGWVDRKYLTRTFGKYGKKEKDKTIDLLINLTKSLQQEDELIFKELFYSLRGLSVFDINAKRLEVFNYKDIKNLWQKISFNKTKQSNNNLKELFDDVLKILESDFIIEYNSDIAKIKNIPAEIVNFEYVLLKCKYDPRLSDISLYIGVEFWNNKPFITSVILRHF